MSITRISPIKRHANIFAHVSYFDPAKIFENGMPTILSVLEGELRPKIHNCVIISILIFA